MNLSSSDLMIALNAAVVDHGIASDAWFRITFGGRPPAGRWTTRPALLADDASGISQVVAAIVRRRPSLDEATVWSRMHQVLGWPVVSLPSAYLANAGRLVRFDPDDVRLGLTPPHQEPGVGGVWITRARVAVLPDDPWAALESPDIEVVGDAHEQYRLLAADACAFLQPLVEVVRSRVNVGRRGLWGMSLDSLLWPFSVERDSDEPVSPRARVTSVLNGFAGTPVAQSVDWVDFEHGDRQHLRMRTTSCCLAYKWPSEPDQQLELEGCDPLWARYCASCPLIPKQESIHRAKYWLDASTGRMHE